MKKTLILFIIVLLFLPANVKSKQKTKINDVYAIIFVLDGLNYDTFTRGIKNGLAPNIKKYFIDEGAYFTNALSLFPSASTTVYQAIVSGLFSGHSGIPYLIWFDRTLEKPVNYFSPSEHKRADVDLLNFRALTDPDEPGLYPKSTIFEHLNEYKTAAVYSLFGANAKYRKPSIPLRAGWSNFASRREEMFDVYAYREVIHLFDQPLANVPRFSLVGLYGFDTLGHHFGAASPLLDYNLEQFDQFLGKFIDLLKEKGIFDKTYIVLTADHGMHDTPKSKFNLKEFVKNTGLILYPGHRRKNDYNTYVASRGISSAHIYLKGEGSWETRPKYKKMLNVIDSLTHAKELKFVVARDGFYRVHVFGKEGHGLIELTTKNGTGLYSYKIVGGADPLELGSSGASRLIGGSFHSADSWGRATANHRYPDAVVQFAQIFEDGRAGDIFVIAEDDWVFYYGKAGTHGSIIRADMHVPLLIRGPTISAGQRNFARIIDVYPTMLNWFGIEENSRHYDGRVLFKSTQPPFYKGGKLLIKKLEKIYSDLEKQKAEPKKYNFTPNVVLDANMWLVKEQLRRITSDAKTLLQ